MGGYRRKFGEALCCDTLYATLFNVAAEPNAYTVSLYLKLVGIQN